MKSTTLDEPGLAELRDRIRRRTGLNFPESRLPDLEAGLRRAMTGAGIGDMRAFAQRLETDTAVFDALIGNLTVGETYFFREPAQFEVLRNRVLPELRRNLPEGAKLRVWSAGCASGEEPYSLAILLEEQGMAESATVLGTDVSRAALQRAREASYGIWSLRGSPGATASPNFERHGDRFVLNARLRRRVEFRYLNLAEDSYPSPENGTAEADLILCRNVMIYFDMETVRQVARRFYRALRPGGWLLTGPSDPPLWDSAPFRTRVTDGGVLYQREDGAVDAAPLRPEPIAFVPPFRPEPMAVEAFADVPAPLPDLPAQEQPAPPPLAANAGDLDAVIAQVRRLADSGSSHAAQAAAIEALRQFPLCPELHYLHAIVCAELGRSEAAIVSLRRVLYIDPSLALAHFMLASVLLRAGRRDEAQRSYQAALATCGALSPDDVLPLSEGEPVRSLIASVRTQLRSMESGMGAVR
jgi:chemotaxis protein methyltransferase CheR